jgi:hypothetical protein
MVISRELTEAQWLKIERLLPKEKPMRRRDETGFE